MTCCEGWTACNGFSLLVLLLLGVILNAIPFVVNLVDEDEVFQNPISCFERWFPGIVGAGLMVSEIYLTQVAERPTCLTKEELHIIFQPCAKLCLGLGYSEEPRVWY